MQVDDEDRVAPARRVIDFLQIEIPGVGYPYLFPHYPVRDASVDYVLRQVLICHRDDHHILDKDLTTFLKHKSGAMLTRGCAYRVLADLEWLALGIEEVNDLLVVDLDEAKRDFAKMVLRG